MTILAALRLLFRPAPRLRFCGRPTTVGLADDRGQVSAPALALTVAVLVLVVGILVTGSHEIIVEAIRSALDAASG